MGGLEEIKYSIYSKQQQIVKIQEEIFKLERELNQKQYEGKWIKIKGNGFNNSGFVYITRDFGDDGMDGLLFDFTGWTMSICEIMKVPSKDIIRECKLEEIIDKAKSCVNLDLVLKILTLDADKIDFKEE